MSSGGGSGGTNTQSTVQTVKIPDFLQDATLKAVDASQQLASQPYQAYQGQTIAGLTPQQLQAIQSGSANASDPTFGQAATDALGRTMAVPGMVNPTYGAAAGTALNAPGAAAPLYGAAAGGAANVPGSTMPLYGAAAGGAASIPGQVNPAYDAAEYMAATAPGASSPYFMTAGRTAAGAGAGAAPLYGAAAGFAGDSATSTRPLYGAGAGVVADASNPGALVDNGAVMSQGDIAPWMSPYISAALDPQLRAIRRQSDQTAMGINRTSAAAGAFGDARAGIQAGMNDRNTMESISNAVGTGYQSAYDRAVAAAQQVAQQRQGLTGQRLTANQQQLAAGTDLAQIASQMGTTEANAGDLLQRIASGQAQTGINVADLLQRIGTAQGTAQTNAADVLQRTASAQGQTGLSAADQLTRTASAMGSTQISASDLLRQIASAQESGSTNAAQTASQIASQMGQTNLAAANQQGTQAVSDYALRQQQAQDLMGYGKTQQDQTQASLSQAYQDFVNQREAPKENLNLLLAAIQGVPYSTTRLTTTPYNSTAANVGALTALLGLGGKLTSSAT
jgi:hypothetical protein